jgi:hypothetical protein
MKTIFYSFLLFLSLIGYSQNFRTEKVVVSKTTKKPLENVIVFNGTDNSTTNQEGKFIFVSNKNDINFSLLGFKSIKTTVEAINITDTVFMEAKAFELKEVVVVNIEPFIKKVYEKIPENFITNYSSDYFLRNVLKKDSIIVKLQDIYMRRNKFPENRDDEIEILNMRKTSILDKKINADFSFPDFKEFFSPPFPIFEKNTFTEVDYNDPDFRKVLFEKKEKNDRGQISKGYFIINRKDYAIVEYFITMNDNPESIPFKKIFLSGTEYRTIKYERLLKFTKNPALNKYYLNNTKLNALVEVLSGKNEGEPFYFNLKMNGYTTNITTEKGTSNFPIDKDIFKAKFPYSEEFWINQNQLPLTIELKNFLKRASESKDKKKEFEVIGNF